MIEEGENMEIEEFGFDILTKGLTGSKHDKCLNLLRLKNN